MENLRNLMDAQQDPDLTEVKCRLENHNALQGCVPCWQFPAMDTAACLCSLMMDNYMSTSGFNCLSNALLHTYGIHHTTGLTDWGKVVA